MWAYRNKPPIRAISFDFANTLYTLNFAEIRQFIAKVADYLTNETDVAVDHGRLFELYVSIRDRQFEENRDTLIENDFHARLCEMMESVGIKPIESLVHGCKDVYASAFIDSMVLPHGTVEAIAKLSKHLNGKIAVCSNFIIADCIRQPLRRDELAPFLKSVIVSCEVGYVKPHPLVFERVIRDLNCDPAEILHVGDDLTADIFGAKQAGMQTAYYSMLCPAQPTHLIESAQPDYCLRDLADLLRYRHGA